MSPAGGLTLLLALITAAASACPACLARSQLRSVSLASIKEQILNKLGLSQPPNMTGRQFPSIPPVDQILDEYSMQADQPTGGLQFKPGPAYAEESDDYSATIEKVIAFAQPHPRMRHWRGQEMLYFRFSEKMMESKVVRAQLWLYLKPLPPTEHYDHQAVTITVLRALRSSNTADTPVFTPLTTLKEARPRGSRGKWVSLEVKRLVSDWFKFPMDNQGIAVQASIQGRDDLHPQHLLVTPSQNDRSSSYYIPFIEVHIADSRKHRTKRTISLNCAENANETRCCRYPLTVDFEEFGWDWIIAPKKYEANYCSGECPLVWFQKYAHTHVVQLASPPGSDGPCCAPRKMSSISMLYFDQEFNIIYGLLPGMVVDRCGCS
ncbi:growth/differentiation factor myoglianin isoform X2 [Rhodnius prolixus]